MLPSASDLIYFYEVAKESNFSRAAKKLHISQPSLSFSIKRLEQLLNTNLFIRHTQGVTLTRAGNKLFENFESLLTQWNSLTTTIEETNQNIKGKVTIGCYSTLCSYMSKMSSNLLLQYPELEIHFKHGLSADIMQHIIEGNVDLGIMTDPYPHANVIIRKIAETEFAFWSSCKQNKEVDLYADELLILADLKIPLVHSLLNELQKLRQHRPAPRICNVDQIEALAAMAINNHGAAILPKCYIELHFKDQLKMIEDTPTYVKPLCMVYRPDVKQVAAVKVVLKAIDDLLQSIKEQSTSKMP
ncbi:LysR family transcriptional regulator [Legionella longbeachae]|uniref:Putative transcriptional regulator, LysR family n=1 Tax=Legionella longbeachae serogroup 1 (strain NSW150) TaxID=661367 RepID=D3HNJ8_LEGLN|nr:LysR family transcriptional regulator [Legionella longbeachae]VEE00988.1 LysR family transcriptional regulator [Legionella oakridgensis]HBD7399275.1 LysR family transcriptional regulator [Legionella pneumophila]ARB92630.1 LysR family transcriptional regulator [Legionella longbeachae]ARM34195.1 LysR family transcriptional regulator [Legionella longbeachae]EEZ96545.1 LysR family transcriptional regulator [Legionella longbeachae D-4968]